MRRKPSLGAMIENRGAPAEKKNGPPAEGRPKERNKMKSIPNGCGLWPAQGRQNSLNFVGAKLGHAPLAILAIVICETLVFFLALKKTVVRLRN